MTAESLLPLFPYLLGFTVLIGFLSALTMGVGIAMSLFYLQAMVSSLKKFNANMDQAQVAFEKLNTSTQAQLITQSRQADAWKRIRKEQLDESTPEQGKESSFPPFRQAWRTEQQ